MNILKRLNRASCIFLSAALFFVLSVPVFADGSGKDSKSSRSISSREKKIYTNDDVEALARNFGASTVGASAPRNQARRQPLVPRSAPAPLSPEKNPSLYAQRYDSLSARIDAIDAQVGRLRDFRTSDAAPSADIPGVKMGLDIYAPCDGITTDNQIQQLLHQRSELEAQISALEDAAHSNGIPSGLILEAAANSQSASNAAAPARQASPATVREELAQIQSRLAAVQGEQTAIQQAAASAGITIAPETKFGGTYTSSYLKRLDNQTVALQAQLSTAEDDARHTGISPALLP